MSEKNDNKVPNVPNLRFNEFIGKWATTTLESLTTNEKKSFAGGPFGSDLKAEDYTLDGIPIIQLSNITEDYLNFNERLIFTSEKKADSLISNNAYPGDLIIAKMMPAGRCCIAQNLYNRYVLGSDAIRVNLDVKKCNKLFMREQINTQHIRKIITSKTAGSTRQRIGIPELKNLSLFSPSIEEQNKIGTFLLKLDTRIETQSKIISNLESLIKGIRQRIFSASTFDMHNSKEYELGSFLTEYSKKNIENNLISVSVGKYGIRRRDEIYSKELSDDYSKNKVIEKDSLIIGMGSTQIDIGILSKHEKYCVSPAYTTYKIYGINSDYLREYLIHLNSLLSKRYMVIGARQGKSVNKSELMQHVLLVHKIEKQLKIVDIFNAFYDKLQKEKDILSLYKKQKAYLLSNMFI